MERRVALYIYNYRFCSAENNEYTLNNKRFS
jgi:hypothetical protein